LSSAEVWAVGQSGRPPHDGEREREEWEMGQTGNLLCAKCGGSVDGWKCAICGSVADEHDAGHLHVGSDRYCTVRCAGCQLADVHCTCV
jgi:hypothetical protein